MEAVVARQPEQSPGREHGGDRHPGDRAVAVADETDDVARHADEEEGGDQHDHGGEGSDHDVAGEVDVETEDQGRGSGSERDDQTRGQIDRRSPVLSHRPTGPQLGERSDEARPDPNQRSQTADGHRADADVAHAARPEPPGALGRAAREVGRRDLGEGDARRREDRHDLRREGNQDPPPERAAEEDLDRHLEPDDVPHREQRRRNVAAEEESASRAESHGALDAAAKQSEPADRELDQRAEEPPLEHPGAARFVVAARLEDRRTGHPFWIGQLGTLLHEHAAHRDHEQDPEPSPRDRDQRRRPEGELGPDPDQEQRGHREQDPREQEAERDRPRREFGGRSCFFHVIPPSGIELGAAPVRNRSTGSAPVPEPGAALLFGAARVAVASARHARRRRAASSPTSDVGRRQAGASLKRAARP